MRMGASLAGRVNATPISNAAMSANDADNNLAVFSQSASSYKQKQLLFGRGRAFSDNEDAMSLQSSSVFNQFQNGLKKKFDEHG
jgi:hypothetical protein